MPHRYDLDSYHASDFDEDFCLKPPRLLWLAALYLSRGMLLPLLVGFGHIAGVNAQATDLMHGLWRIDELIPSFLAALVLYALLRRTHGAPSHVRGVWAHGRTLLALSAGLDIALSIYALSPFTGSVEDYFSTVAACAADVYFGAYVLAARRIRDTFSDFP